MVLRMHLAAKLLPYCCCCNLQPLICLCCFLNLRSAAPASRVTSDLAFATRDGKLQAISPGPKSRSPRPPGRPYPTEPCVASRSSIDSVSVQAKKPSRMLQGVAMHMQQSTTNLVSSIPDGYLSTVHVRCTVMHCSTSIAELLLMV